MDGQVIAIHSIQVIIQRRPSLKLFKKVKPMKLAVCSDLHLEFGDLELKNEENADVLILSGDICIASEFEYFEIDGEDHARAEQRARIYYNFLKRCCDEFPHVIMVMGNHEHYHGNYSSSARKLREFFGYLPNVHILDREVRTFGDVTFIGGTLWTDMNNHDSLTLYHMRTMMNDFRIIWHGDKGRKFSPEDSVTEHVKMKQYIDVVTQEQPDKKFVVCGHHSPSRLSTHPMYADDTVMNGGYSSDLSEFILDHPQDRKSVV